MFIRNQKSCKKTQLRRKRFAIFAVSLKIRYEWLLELKYCKASAPATDIATKREKGLEQLEAYARSHRMKDRTDLKAALIVFIGKDKFEITEIA